MRFKGCGTLTQSTHSNDQVARFGAPASTWDEIEQKSPGERAAPEEPSLNLRRWIGLAAGLVIALLVFAVMPADVAHNARLTAAVAVLMAIWWMTEALPLSLIHI